VDSTQTTVVFIVRASVSDGLGHLVRSLCVLRELQARCTPLLLLLGDKSGTHLIDAAKVQWLQCSCDEDAAVEAIKFRPKVIVFDTLRFERQAFDRVASHGHTVSISPVFSQMCHVQHLFHRTINEDPAWSKEPSFPKIHKGLKYAVLPGWLRRVSSRHYREQLQEDRLAVAISMGGADAPNRTLALLKLFNECPARLVLFVALGDGYTHSYADLLASAASNRQEIILLKSNESMWRVLRSVSLVVCAGGLTTYEAAFIGLPAINILQRAEWSYLFDELTQQDACRTIPPVAGSLETAVQMVCELEQHRERLAQMNLATRRLVPSGGAARIARKLLVIAEQRS
jgi:spore coat polysaccharide biosynthesis predicted glycosyltransferase SpsG